MQFSLRRACTVLLAISLFYSCSEEDPTKGPEAIEPPAVLDMPIYKSVYPIENGTLDVQDSVVVSFHEKKGKQQKFDNVLYRAIIDQVTLTGVTTTSVWANDSLSVTLYPEDMLDANASYQVQVNAHWEVYESSQWHTVLWEDVQLTESHALNFTTSVPAIEIEGTNILYAYPIANQYHFLVEEHPTGFIKLNRGQQALFSLTTHSFWAVFKKSTGEEIESEITYQDDDDQIEFDIPTSLQNETIYEFQLIARKIDNLQETVLTSYHFRTSKYRTFTAKFNALTYNGNVFSILIAPWRGHYLYNFVSGAGEYFDSFEAEVKHVNIQLGETVYAVPYNSNLVQFEAIMEGTDWYDNALYPWLYAPWTESSFKPTVTRDTSLVGYPPVRAMSFNSCGSGMLTPEIIESNLAPAIAPSTNPAIVFSLPVIIWQDFNQIQAQAVARYLQQSVVADREEAILFNSMPAIRPGTYQYKVKYTLPSGEVTTMLTQQMVY